MAEFLDLLDDTMNHFNEGAVSVRAHSKDITYIITRVKDSDDFWVTLEEPGFPKTKTHSLRKYFGEVFGIEAIY